MVSVTQTAGQRTLIAKMINKREIAILTLTLIMISLANAFTCGDNICDVTETYHSCPQDCPSGGSDNYCDKVDDNICDPDCFDQDPDCEGYKPTIPININQTKGLISLNTLIMVGLFLLIGFVIFIVLRTINKQKGTSYLDIKQRQKQGPEEQISPENPFNKYRYLFKQQNFFRKK